MSSCASAEGDDGRTEVVAPGTDAVRFVDDEASELLAAVQVQQQVAERVALDDLRASSISPRLRLRKSEDRKSVV